jgi:hypothetical protein
MELQTRMGEFMPFLVQACLDGHTLALTTATAKEAYNFEDPMLDHTHLFPNTGDFTWSTFQSKKS